MPPTPELQLPESVRVGLSQRADDGKFELPVLSDTASRVLSASQNAKCDVQEIAALIERDQSLAGHVLYLSNSAAFAPREPIVSLQQAIARLGLSTLCDVTVAIVLKGSVFQIAGFERTLAELWQHSAAAGTFAKEVARALRRNVEGAFLCGLLHDVGKPIALRLLADVCKDTKVPLSHELAEAAMEQYHPLLGGMLVKQWGLSPWIEVAAEHHHDYDKAEHYRTEAMVTHFADELAHWAMGTKDLSEDDLFDLQVVADLDLYESDVQRLLEAKDRAIEIAEAFI